MKNISKKRLQEIAGIKEEDYRMQHRAPGKDRGAPLWDVTKEVYPEDFYTLPVQTVARYYGTGQGGDLTIVSIIRNCRNNPNALVNVYRAVPHNVKSINPGDWVTLFKPYAVTHSYIDESPENDYKILSKTVKASELYTDGNSIYEWGWDPQLTSKEDEAMNPKDEPVKLKDVAKISTNMSDADFWITRKGSLETVGKPVKSFDAEKIGIKVTGMDTLYLFYKIQYLWTRGKFKQLSRGTTNLVHIKTEDVANISLEN